MSKIKELRNSEELNFNLVDLVENLVPEKKSKYVELFINLLKKTPDYDLISDEMKKHFIGKLNVDEKFINETPTLRLFFYYSFLEKFFDVDDITTFQRFCDLNEQKHIKQNDLSKYKSFEEIVEQKNIAELKLSEKELEKQVVKIHENDEWVVLRPLTYKASCKYGSNTKWCTTFEDKNYFYKYSRGILIYIINKNTNQKVAVYREIKEKKDDLSAEFSFWNSLDNRVDSLNSGLPNEILSIILKEINENYRSNDSYVEKKSSSDDLKSLLLGNENFRFEGTTGTASAGGVTGNIGITESEGFMGELESPEPPPQEFSTSEMGIWTPIDGNLPERYDESIHEDFN